MDLAILNPAAAGDLVEICGGKLSEGLVRLAPKQYVGTRLPHGSHRCRGAMGPNDDSFLRLAS
jgi:hypothetical protein